mgnify:CR=1 FL=1
MKKKCENCLRSVGCTWSSGENDCCTYWLGESRVFNTSGIRTGRMKCSDPNLQNIPVRTEEGDKIRRAFINCV